MRAIRALPTLLRIGVAETVAYRGEFLVWILTTTQPLIMLGLWTSVAADSPGGMFGNYSSERFVAYFLADLLVRQLTGNWVAWQLMEDIRLGQMSMRLLRPIHPFFAYATSHLAAIPFRTIIAMPLVVILLASSGASALTRDPMQIAAFVPSLALAWIITFAVLFAIGSLAFFMTQTMAIATAYFAIYQVFSGYMLPLDLMPHWISTVADWLPFKYTLWVPIQLLIEPMPPERIAELLAAQGAWAAITLGLALFVWKLGVRRFEAVGG
jgi:ABC-2 type transport system permease protein